MISVHELGMVYQPQFFSRSQAVLHGIDFEMKSGETVAFIGPNGAGKSTLIKLMFNLLFPTRGELRMFDLPAWDPAWRNRAGYLPELFIPMRWIKGRDSLRMAGALRGLDRTAADRRIEELTGPLDLEPLLDHRVGRHSRGMAQRLGIAHSVIHDPELLVMDEPTANLDPTARKKLLDYLEARKHRGLSLLLCSHLLGEVESIADRVVFLNHGEIKADMKMGEALAASGWSFSFRLPAGSGVALTGRDFAGAAEHRLDVQSDREKNELVAAVVAAGGEILSLAPARRTLEQKFLEWLQ